MRATVPARGSPPNMPVTTMTGSRIARMTTDGNGDPGQHFLAGLYHSRLTTLWFRKNRLINGLAQHFNGPLHPVF